MEINRLSTPDRPRGWFITGTDTGVGKTWVACRLLGELNARGRRAAGMKPVASGATPSPAGLRNADALALAAASHCALPYATLNPYAFADPIAPHIAAEKAGIIVDVEVIEREFRQMAALSEVLIVEGAGGWRVPLGGELSIASLAARLALPVILVVGLRLGCLNHAILTVEAIRADGLDLAGWIGNEIEPSFAERAANLRALERALAPAPCLGLFANQPVPNTTDPAAGLVVDRLYR